MNTETIVYSNQLCVDDFNRLRQAGRLRRAVGWEAIKTDRARTGLAQSAFIVSASAGGAVVGMARIVGDGGYIAYICDVVVHLDFQGRGIGRELMERVMAHLRGGMEPGDRIFVSLMATKGKEGFYKKLGFLARPDEIHGPGMMINLTLPPGPPAQACPEGSQ